ncbi:hypothetical protein KDA_32610 [Dictyobacter alpinus]|uniref:Uncharacterized protein n=1 Tax=Dictyobacter alpinus TaxID=2014873 RepID=A0A402B8X9_9CHLR|nr:hypothetical protein KDA_32610 [Dictyobacter alpinus]
MIRRLVLQLHIRVIALIIITVARDRVDLVQAVITAIPISHQDLALHIMAARDRVDLVLHTVVARDRVDLVLLVARDRVDFPVLPVVEHVLLIAEAMPRVLDQPQIMRSLPRHHMHQNVIAAVIAIVIVAAIVKVEHLEPRAVDHPGPRVLEHLVQTVDAQVADAQVVVPVGIAHSAHRNAAQHQ